MGSSVSKTEMKVLIVEDDPHHSLLLSILIKRHCGKEPLVARNVADAKFLIQNDEDLDAIVCDSHLPDGTFRDVVALAESKSRKIPILIYANETSDELGIEGLNLLGVVTKDKAPDVCRILLNAR